MFLALYEILDMNKDLHRYDNLIDNARPAAKNPMDSMKRAAQFAPFAALTGYDDQISETARITADEIYLDESEIAVIDRQLQYINEHLDERKEVEITYYVSDQEMHHGSAKSGGAYISKKGVVKKIDAYEGVIIFTDGDRVAIKSVVQLS